MGLRDKLLRLERRAEDRRAEEELKAVFMSTMARLEAQISGAPLPPPHSRSNDPRFAGTFLDGEQRIVDGDGVPINTVEDLSE